MHNLQITAELTPDPQEGGYSVYCPELDIYSQGDTAEEAIIGYIKVIGMEEAIKEFKPPIRETLELALP